MSLYGIAIENTKRYSSQLTERDRISSSIASALKSCGINKCVIFSANNSVYLDVHDHNLLTTYLNQEDKLKLNINHALLFIIADDKYYNDNLELMTTKFNCFKEKLKEMFFPSIGYQTELIFSKSTALIKISQEMMSNREILFNIDALTEPQPQPQEPNEMPMQQSSSPEIEQPKQRFKKRSRSSEEENVSKYNKYEKLREKFEKINLDKISIQRELDECKINLLKCDSERDNLIAKLDGLRDEIKGFKSKDPETLRRSILKLNNELKRIIEEQEELERQEEMRRKEERRKKEEEERRKKESDDRRKKESDDRRQEERRKKESEERRQEERRQEERKQEERRKKESEERKQEERRKEEMRRKENQKKRSPVAPACPSKDKNIPDCSKMNYSDKIKTFRRMSLIFHPDKNPGCKEESEIKFKELNDKCNPPPPSPTNKKGGSKKSKRRKNRGRMTRKV
jgi:hypothetical protein